MKALTALKALIALAIILTAAMVSFPAIWWAYDVWQDRTHTLSVNENTSVFIGKGDESCGGAQLAVVAPATSVQVRRIRYWKNCATVDVELADGRRGYIVFDGRNVTITPPLP
jgi:hypothetical protein